jgi:uncharacterized protein (DUF1778 family)
VYIGHSERFHLTIRIGATEKQRIVEASRLAGKSITGFVLEAVMSSVETSEASASIEAKSHSLDDGPCPAFFRALCQTAQAGGEAGYGFALTGALPAEVPYELDWNEWGEQLDVLEALLAARRDGAAVESWFATNLPRCIALVPKRRRVRFVQGVRNRFEKDGGLRR